MWTWNKVRWWGIGLSIFVGLWVNVAVVLGHGYLVRAIPEDRATLERMPPRLQFWFSESLEPQFSTMQLLNQAGEWIADGQVDPQDNALLVLNPPVTYPKGRISWSCAPRSPAMGTSSPSIACSSSGNQVDGVEVGESSTQAPRSRCCGA
ncbi:MAG UNVERIFIED_CONTAM: copper resistance protein CopC [Anaerolineae bacterium]|jgi:methionine-rich copper-binding protein CopC